MTKVSGHPNITDARWFEYGTLNVDDWEVIYADIDGDYQGSCEFIARTPGSWKVRYIESAWSWGSCSGCDGYEDLTPDEITIEFLTRNREYLTLDALKGKVALLKDSKYPNQEKIAAIEAEIQRVEG